MAKLTVSDWDETAANNTDIDSIPIDGAVTTPSQVDDIVREMMSQIKTFSLTVATTAASSTDNAIARFDSTSGNIQNSGVIISDSNVVTGGAWNGTVGATTPASGAFTTLSASGAAALSSTLSVTGAAALSSTLSVAGAAALSSTLSVTGNLTVNSLVRLTSDGGILTADKVIGGAGGNEVGIGTSPDGFIDATALDAISGIFHRRGTDGSVILIRNDGADVGGISVSGGTTSYNAFMGSHWSQLADGSNPELLRGTIVETIDEMCAWHGEGDEDRLARFKVSDTVGAAAVYGVFLAWDDDDHVNNDAYIAALGASWVRIAQGVTVQRGDLIESNGDGCGRVQADDLFRAGTVAKITAAIPVETYSDGSKLYPCTLHCG